METIQIDNGAEVNFNSDKFIGNYVSIKEEYPFIEALANRDYEMLSLLKSKGMAFANKFSFEIQ